MIKIISGWSNPGGSTTAHINLCNAFNARGYDCTFYGPHDFHLDKCKAKKLSEFSSLSNDCIIAHFIDVDRIKTKCLKMVYSCHEKDVHPMSKVNYSQYDKIHYVSEPQRLWHNIDHPFFVSGNILDDLMCTYPKKREAVGIIGSIDYNKQTHKSIQRALTGGHKEIFLFGDITDKPYFEQFVKPLLSDKVKHVGFAKNKQMMYDHITDVYQDSISETWGYVKAECILTGTRFHGSSATDNNFDRLFTNDEIVKKWLVEIL